MKVINNKKGFFPSNLAIITHTLLIRLSSIACVSQARSKLIVISAQSAKRYKCISIQCVCRTSDSIRQQIGEMTPRNFHEFRALITHKTKKQKKGTEESERERDRVGKASQINVVLIMKS